MAYAMFTSPVNGISEVTLVREGRHKIQITTEQPLSDDQMQDLYWVTLAMHKTGKRLKDLFKNESEVLSDG